MMFVNGFPKIISNRGEIAGTVHRCPQITREEVVGLTARCPLLPHCVLSMKAFPVPGGHVLGATQKSGS